MVIEKRWLNERVTARVGQFAGQDFYGAQHDAASFLFEPMGYALGWPPFLCAYARDLRHPSLRACCSRTTFRPNQRGCRGTRGAGDQSNGTSGSDPSGNGCSNEASAGHHGSFETERHRNGTECRLKVTTPMGANPWNRCCPFQHSPASRGSRSNKSRLSTQPAIV